VLAKTPLSDITGEAKATTPPQHCLNVDLGSEIGIDYTNRRLTRALQKTRQNIQD
jgi:hypothetical protein